uniref:Uncharacterized protein n=1 Tax=Strongyloides venezuelensis TaxID=75913 RepID=A0A0K0FBN5_STRVS
MEKLSVEQSSKNSKYSSKMTNTRPSQASIRFENDPFNIPEHYITLRGKELIIFTIGYIIAVILILIMFECLMPVLFTDDYYNVPSKN